MMEAGRQSLVRWCGLLVMITGLQTVAGQFDFGDFSNFIMRSCQDMNGGWSPWGEWSKCDCVTRMMYRERRCDNPEPAGRGLACFGAIQEVKSCAGQCQELPCWDAWTDWGQCDCSAGANATKSRERQCSTIDTTENDCYGQGKNQVDIMNCNVECASPVWGNWKEYSLCNATGDMTESRERVCTIPEGSILNCVGINEESRPCVSVNGQWGEWTPWGYCLCDAEGNGNLYRIRLCDNPEPNTWGTYCTGDGKESQECNSSDCVTTTPVAPTSTVAVGRRLLAYKDDAHNNHYSNRKLLWDAQNCPVNGGWSEWEPWGNCKCGGNVGTKTRKRTCNNPEPTACANDCEGSKSEMTLCVDKKCEDNTNMCEYCEYTYNTGYYRDPTDCRHFYMCTRVEKGKGKGKKYLYTSASVYCSEGLVFSEEFQTCMWPGEVDDSEKCYAEDPCSNADIRVEADPSCSAYVCWPEPTLPFRHCCEPFHSFSVGARRCVPDNDCLPDPMCITPMILQDDTSDDDVREGCMQNGVNYQTKNANGKYIVVVTGEVRTCPKGASGKRMQFDDTKGKCACFDNGPAQTQCKDEPYLVAYIPFDNDFNDKSCNKLTGSHRGKVNLLSGGPKGGYAHFVKGKLEIPYFNNWFGTSRPSFSIALWICLDKVNLKNDQGIVHNGNCLSNPSIQIEVHDEALFTQMNQKNGTTIRMNPPLLDNWTHVTMTFDNGQVTLYINGVQAMQYMTVGSVVYDTNCELIFGQLGSKGHFKGKLDEILLYEIALSASDVLRIYNQAAPQWYNQRGK